MVSSRRSGDGDGDGSGDQDEDEDEDDTERKCLDGRLGRESGRGQSVGVGQVFSSRAGWGFGIFEVEGNGNGGMRRECGRRRKEKVRMPIG